MRVDADGDVVIEHDGIDWTLLGHAPYGSRNTLGITPEILRAAGYVSRAEVEKLVEVAVEKAVKMTAEEMTKATSEAFRQTIEQLAQAGVLVGTHAPSRDTTAGSPGEET